MRSNKRYVCTAESPWDPRKGAFVSHPDAVDDGECYEGCCDYFKCPHCGVRFRVEAPQ